MKKLATIPASQYFLTDGKKLGWIKVDFEREFRWAMPSFGVGAFIVPTPEWVDAYGSRVYVLVDELDGSPNLIWTGFIWQEGKLPTGASIDYPYTKLWTTENWEIKISDKPGSLSLELKRADNQLVVQATNDGFKITVDPGYVIIENDDIHLGGSAGEKAVVGESFKSLFNSHTHSTGAHGAPTSSPLKRMSTPHLSTKVRIVK